MKKLFRRSVTRRGFLAGLSGVGAAVATGCSQGSSSSAGGSSSSSASATPTKLAIIHTNDTHGHDIRDDESLGLAAVVQLKQDYINKGYEVLLVDAGDVAQGKSLVSHSKGMQGIDFLNLCGYDAMTLGNHEFDYGQDYITDYESRAEFPLLSANVIVDATGEPLVRPNTIFTLGDGRKVGFFGITTPETYTKASPLLVKGLTFLQGEELWEAAQEQADELRDAGCELVVCLAHLGNLDESAPNRSQDVVPHVSGVDIYIDGHDHKERQLTFTDASGKDVPVVDADCFTHAVGVVTWEDGKLSYHFEHFGEYEGQDATVAASIKKADDELKEEFGQVLAETPFVLDGQTDPGVRTKETNLGDLVADALLWQAQRMADDTPDAVVINGGSIRASIQAGDITLGDAMDVLPFINYVCTIKLTGDQLLEALEASTAVTPTTMGAFPQVAGIEYSIDTTKEFKSDGNYPDSTFGKPSAPGTRVTIAKVGDRDFVETDTYTIAASDFVCAGGDSYFVFAEVAATTMKQINYLVNECFRNYLGEELGGVVPDRYAKAQGRITIIE